MIVPAHTLGDVVLGERPSVDPMAALVQEARQRAKRLETAMWIGVGLSAALVLVIWSGRK